MLTPESSPGFFYVGNDRANLAKLVAIYGRGFASDGPALAAGDLTGTPGCLPAVICCEASFGVPAIRTFGRLLAGDPRLARVPLVITVKDPLTGVAFARIPRVDEILNPEDWKTGDLARKFRFLCRMRQQEPARTRTGRRDWQTAIERFLKRTFDLMVALTAILLLAPLFCLIALGIRAESRGPVFYIAKRAGRGYRIFDFYKFRTMRRDAERQLAGLAGLNQYALAGGPRFFKLSDDPRITRFGRFLRNTSLDELPQLLNVVRGDMSLVGNRPLPLYEAETLTTDDLAARFDAPAGMTGLWQIRKRGRRQMSAEERIRLDLDYASQSSFLYDLRIMAETPRALLQRANA